MKILVANRGEIACRILATLREMGIASVAVYTEPDAQAAHIFMADESVKLNNPNDYNNYSALLNAAKQTKSQAIHPGYGFVSEQVDFKKACDDAGVIFIGPSIAAMNQLGDKAKARQLAQSVGVNVIPGINNILDINSLTTAAAAIGYPLMLKAVLGGGGRGIRFIENPDQLEPAFNAATREANTICNDSTLLLEKCIVNARHIEVQILANGKKVIALGERECSLQRRNQKLIEEAPAVGIAETTRQHLISSAIAIAEAAQYSGAGTAEFLLDTSGQYYFLEFNPRLQVEHPVTEMLTGVDIVRAQVELALGGKLPEGSSIRGHAIEARLCAEDPFNSYVPQAGRIEVLELPHLPGVRIDSSLYTGSIISSYYDSLLCKIIAWGQNREQARQRLLTALKNTTILGIITNQNFLVQLLESDLFASGASYTTAIDSRTWIRPELPVYARAAAEQVLLQKHRSNTNTKSQINSNEDYDIYSPWRVLSRFRIGQ
ncbi:MAG: ATP-grasp domain-containing protein [Deltaproteobacteria bacterium]|nr:ATP-grasp domain-containing protein [Deltaproteobacteria bacterium]